MLRNEEKPAFHKIIPTSEGNRYQFFCDLSGALVCTTTPLRGDTAEGELLLAWETQGRAQFNLCHNCGKWVMDAVYNADVCECVQCTPWEEQSPHFCKHCGSKAAPGEVVCSVCQKRLCY